MPLIPLSPQAARDLIEQGAVLLDIRSADEFARERIAQARHWPPGGRQDRIAGNVPVIFHCRSGVRTQLDGAALAALAPGRAHVLVGGLDAWKKAGLPLHADASQPLELQRQVQIVAGSLVLLGTVLGLLASPWFLALAGFVGAGLVFAGVSGFCGMARLLLRMPWNRPRAAG